MAPAVVIVVDLAAAWLLSGGIALASWLGLRWRRRNARPEARQEHTKLEAALQRIREFTQSQGRFVGMLTEQIRAPLATARRAG